MGRHKTYQRDDVLAKARDCFWKEGYAGAHLSKLVETTGLNRFSLYKEFTGKEGLFQEALELYAREAFEYYEHFLSKAPLGLDNIRRYFAGIQIAPDYHGCFIVNTLAEQAVVPESAFNVARNFVEQVEGLFHANLVAALRNDEISSSIDIATLAKTLTSLDNGISVYGIVRPDQKVIRKMAKSAFEAVLGSTETTTLLPSAEKAPA